MPETDQLTDSELRQQARERVRYMSDAQIRADEAELRSFARPSRQQRAMLTALTERRERTGALFAAAANPAARVLGVDASYSDQTAREARDRESDMNWRLDPRMRIGDHHHVIVSKARASVERQHHAGHLHDRAALWLDRKLTSGPVEERAGLGQYLNATGADLYVELFARVLFDPDKIVFLSDEERAVIDNARQASRSLGVYERALVEGTPAAWSPGSFPVPYQLDPTVLLTSSGVNSQIRAAARVEQIVGKEWLGVTSGGVTVSRANELDVATDASPTLGQPGVAPTRVQAFVPFSVEVEQDWNGLLAEISMMLADGKDVEEATSYLTGAGTGNAPQGILTGMGTAQEVLTAGTGSLAPGDVYAVESAVPPRFRARSSWLASRPGYNAIRSAFATLASSAGDPWVRPSAATPPELIGYPTYENSNMAATVASAAKLAILGDWKQFLIVDRIGMSIELVPHIFSIAANGSNLALPTGQRGVYAMWRNSSQVLIPNAFRYLQVR